MQTEPTLRSVDDPLIGTMIAGRYRLESRLGVGAMGSVYRARHVVIDRSAAIKVLNSEFLGRESSRAWFVREARAVNRVNHANIAEIYDLGESDDGRVYLVMELLEGIRLIDHVNDGPMDLALSLSVIEQAASALARAHGLGVVHRDIKPEHVFLVERGGRDDFVKLIDFGLARLVNEGRIAARGSVFGTPAYLSPEQARGQDAGPQADLYGLGVVFFEMLTGRPPFNGPDHDDLIRCHLSVEPPDPAEFRGGLDPECSRIILKLLAKDLEHRYRDAHHLVDDCKKLQTRTRSDASFVHVQHTPQSAPGADAVRIDGVAAAALKASLFGRMAAVVYPSGNGPDEVVDAVQSMWSLIAELSRAEGELEIVSRWDENLRQRSREFVAEFGRKIDDLTRARSETDRRLTEANRQLAKAERLMEIAQSKRDASRALVASFKDKSDNGTINATLHTAAAAAAEIQSYREEIAAHEVKIDRQQQQQAHLERQIRRFRRELESHSSRIDADLERGKPRLSSLGRRRETCIRAIDGTVALLRGQFDNRPACRHLLGEINRLFPMDAQPHDESIQIVEPACED